MASLLKHVQSPHCTEVSIDSLKKLSQDPMVLTRFVLALTISTLNEASTLELKTQWQFKGSTPALYTAACTLDVVYLHELPFPA